MFLSFSISLALPLTRLQCIREKITAWQPNPNNQASPFLVVSPNDQMNDHQMIKLTLLITIMSIIIFKSFSVQSCAKNEENSSKLVGNASEHCARKLHKKVQE